MTTFVKGPKEQLDYTQDWSDWLANGEQIASSSWTVPTGLVSRRESNDTTSATIWLHSGDQAGFYKVRNHVTTTNSPTRKGTRTFFVEVTKR